MLGSARRVLPSAALCVALGLALPASGCASYDGDAALAPTSASPARATQPEVTTVIAVSIDGLNPRALSKLGKERAPVLHRLIRQGASTLNARTSREQTNTLPNHTGMVTGRRIKAARGGHGVTWNDERLRPRTVQEAAGRPVSSVFTVVKGSGRDTALFASKQKFSLFERSWDAGIDRFVVRENNQRLTKIVRADIRDTTRALRFVHLSAPDRTGHDHGFMSAPYLDAVAASDRRLGRIVAAVEARPKLSDRTVVVVTSDHGGLGVSHRDPTKRHNYRIPFVVWGAGVARGADLYDLNDAYRDPGRARTTYAGPQPIRNGMVANLVTDLLGLDPVPGSKFGKRHDLRVK